VILILREYDIEKQKGLEEVFAAINEVIKLLEIIKSDQNNAVKQNAILQLTLLIERSNTIDRNKPEYLLNLSQAQLIVTLFAQEQIEIASHIFTFLTENIDDVNCGSLLWTISKAKSLAVIEPLQAFMIENYTQLDVHALYQGTIALQNCFFDSKLFEENVTIDRIGLNTMLQELQTSSDTRIAECAKNILEILSDHTDE
jgi:hypothetical protein